MSSDKEHFSGPSILLILMGSLGDVVRGLSLVSQIKKNLPNSRITWLVEPKWVELITIHPDIDKILVFNRNKGVLAVWQLKKALDQEHFDITLDLQRHFKSGFFSLLSRAERRIGFNRRNTKEFNWLFNNETIDFFSERLPKVQHYLKFTEYLGIPAPDVLDFGFSSFDFKSVLPDILSDINGPIISVVMGSSWESKNWFFEGYRGLIQDLFGSGKQHVVLLGDCSQESASFQLAEYIGSPSLINLVGKTSLLEVAAVLKVADVAVGPDSGPAHIAGAVGTPYVTLFGPTSPQRVAPYGSEHLVVQAGVACAPCYKKRCPGLNRRCMRKITVVQVKERISEALVLVEG